MVLQLKPLNIVAVRVDQYLLVQSFQTYTFKLVMLESFVFVG